MITAMLSWYDEPPGLLAEGIASLKGCCDRIVALDGPYRYMDGWDPVSPPEQAQAIREAADSVGIACVIGEPRAWAGQIEKRQALIELALPDSDWLFVHDADHLLIGWPTSLREWLRRCEPNVVTVELRYRTPAVDGATLTLWHDWLTTTEFYAPIIYRALPEFRVERHHWWYSGLLNGERVALEGWDKSGGDLEGADQYVKGLHASCHLASIEHRCFDRPPERLAQQRAMYARRDELVATTGEEP